MSDQIIYRDYQFETGADYRGLAPQATPPANMVGIESDQGQASDQNNGGAQTRPGADAMDGLTSDGRPFFNDGAHGADAGGMDAMSGLPDGSHVETLLDNQVYGAQESLPFVVVPETASPLLEKE